MRTADTALRGYKRQLAALEGNEMVAFIEQPNDIEESERPAYFAEVEAIEVARSAVATAATVSQ